MLNQCRLFIFVIGLILKSTYFKNRNVTYKTTLPLIKPIDTGKY